ncbi:Trifunctional nucleotide phosphoesterase protein YfkN precursor [Eubacterium limosum]|uniref:Trifunctional nucleotide phosphoesterase protein YfkN n=1 Tax=Eubacterium limosum TaxID=1736 RepID=A0A6N3GY76_EUBLI
MLELISTKEGQEVLTRDIQMGYSYLKDYQPEHSDVITGLEEYVDSSYVYNVQFPDKIVEYLGEMSRQVFVGKLTPEDALKAVDKYYYEGSDQVDYDLSVVGTIKNDLLLQDYNTRRKEAEIGNLLADSVAEVSGASIAVVNGGGIRGSLYAGEVYGSDLAAVCPFDNQVVVLEMNGQVLWDILENSLSACTDTFPGGRFLQVSGIRYTFDSSKEPGARLKNDYMAGKQGYAENNGDGYTMLNVYSGDIPKGSVRLVKETDLTYRDALAQYFENHRNAPVSAELEGRITDTGKSE